jgi:hypothetical protein
MTKPLALILLLLLAAEEEPPTPAERIAALRKEQAAERVKLASWAVKKKLGTDAEAHFRAAVALDPDNRTAASRLDRGKTFRDGRGARDKHGEELLKREAERTREEAAAFGALGVALHGEGETALARPLLLRAHFLAPADAGVAKALGLVPIHRRFGTADEAEILRASPKPEDASGTGFLAARVGVKTTVMACGAVTAEPVGHAKSLGDLARMGDQAHRLTALRFGTGMRGTGWIILVAASGKQQFDRYIDALGVQDPWRSNMKKLGTSRVFRPRHAVATFIGPMGDPRNRAPLFLHTLPENLLLQQAPQRVPAWLHEAVGIDTCFTFIDRPGTLCVAYESSTGLRVKGALDDGSGWPPLLLKRAASGHLPKFEHMVTAQLQALGHEDLMAAHAYYRWLLLNRREKLATYLVTVRTEKDRVKAFTDSFGMKPEELTAALVKVLLGSN